GTEEEEHEEAESMENSDESETPDPKDEEMMKEGEMMMDDDKMMMDDDKMMMDDDKMMMDDDKMMKGGELMAEIDVLGGDTAEAGEQIPIDVTVTMMDNAEGKMIHLWYDLVATQSGETILEVKDGHSHDGKIADLKTNPLLAAPSDDAPIMITVTSQGMAPPLSDGSAPPVEERTGSIGTVISEKQIVPEFGSIAMMILAVAVISIVAVTAKSRIVPRI
ncbi:MAG: PEFG-CTERM sorting domain-containing protein, partial [Nitrosopumilus sp. H13]